MEWWNPPSFPPIQYYLKDRVNSGDVKFEIYDATGRLVQSVPGTKRKGINQVSWNLRMTPPKVASGGVKMDNAGFIAPMVLPGEYTIKLKVADKEFTEKMTLIHDESDSNLSMEDRKLQHKTAMELYNLHVALSKLVEEVNSKQSMLKLNKDKLKDTKAQALFNEYHVALDNLRGTLLASKQKSIFADEEQLRERITEVYGAVAMQEARPSNLQIQRVSVLQKELQEASKKHAAIIKKFDADAKKELAKEGLDKDNKTF